MVTGPHLSPVELTFCWGRHKEVEKDTNNVLTDFEKDEAVQRREEKRRGPRCASGVLALTCWTVGVEETAQEAEKEQ